MFLCGQVRASVEACVEDELALWARGARGTAEAQALGWLGNSSDGGAAVNCEPFTTHAGRLEDHLVDLFDGAYHQARKHVVRYVPSATL